MEIRINLSGSQANDDMSLLMDVYQALQRLLEGSQSSEDTCTILFVINQLTAEIMKHLPNVMVSG